MKNLALAGITVFLTCLALGMQDSYADLPSYNYLEFDAFSARYQYWVDNIDYSNTSYLYWMEKFMESLNHMSDLVNVMGDQHIETLNDFQNYNLHKTIIQGTEITWEIQDSKGNWYSWTMPVEAYEELVQWGAELSEYYTYEPITLYLDNGETILAYDYDGFVGEEGSFGNVIDDIYDNSYSDSDFIYEIHYIVSKLTVYDEDLRGDNTDEGRYALETLTRGGGDCEDLAILIADMLKSSKHTKDWEIQYVYMDNENPTNAQDVNHIVVFINDGTYDYVIEATGNDPYYDYYPDGISGWFFDV